MQGCVLFCGVPSVALRYIINARYWLLFETDVCTYNVPYSSAINIIIVMAGRNIKFTLTAIHNILRTCVPTLYS